MRVEARSDESVEAGRGEGEKGERTAWEVVADVGDQFRREVEESSHAIEAGRGRLRRLRRLRRRECRNKDS
jgi:hypothetical protein